MDDRESSPEPEETVSQLPDYDLPKRREKTNVERYGAQKYEIESKPKSMKEKSPAEWERLQPKEQEEWDVGSSIVLGKGKKPGIMRLVHNAVIFNEITF